MIKLYRLAKVEKHQTALSGVTKCIWYIRVTLLLQIIKMSQITTALLIVS